MGASFSSRGLSGVARAAVALAALVVSLVLGVSGARADEAPATPAAYGAPIGAIGGAAADRPPPDLTDRVGIGYDGTLRGLSALAIKYWSKRIGFQAMLGVRIAALDVMNPGMSPEGLPGFGLGAALRLLFKLVSGDLAQLNLAAGVGLDIFKPFAPPGIMTASNFDFIAELGIQPEVFITRSFTVHALVGVAILVPFEDESPTGNTGPVLTIGGSEGALLGVLAGFGFTYYFAPL